MTCISQIGEVWLSIRPVMLTPGKNPLYDVLALSHSDRAFISHGEITLVVVLSVKSCYFR